MKLRALEPTDIDKIYAWENDPAVWQHSAAHTPFSKHLLTQFVMSAMDEDIFTSRQLRLVAEVDGEAVGCVDLYDFDPFHHRAAVAILVDSAQRGRGFAVEMLQCLMAYAPQLQLHQLYCHVAVDNAASLAAFTRCGFSVGGTLKDWLFDTESLGYKDAVILQKTL